MIPLQFPSQRDRSLCHLRLNRAFDVPECIETPEDSAKEALCDLIAQTPEMDIGAMLRLSDELLVSRDIVTTDAAIFDIGSLADHFRVTRSEMIMAARLCGARAFHKGAKTVWADAEQARFTLDAATIECANDNLEGRA